MEVKSAIEKGKRLEKWFIDQLKQYGIDDNARREAGSGNGLKKGDIFTTMDFMSECKNEAKVPKGFLDNVDQAKAQAQLGYHDDDKWLLITRDPREAEFNSVFVTMDVHQFLMLYKKAMEPKIVNPDRELKYLFEQHKIISNKIIKKLTK